jgi:hypothetical protein
VADDSVERDLHRIEQLRDRVAAAEVAMERIRRALDTGWNPDELRERYTRPPRRSEQARLSCQQLQLSGRSVGPNLSHTSTNSATSLGHWTERVPNIWSCTPR